AVHLPQHDGAVDIAPENVAAAVAVEVVGGRDRGLKVLPDDIFGGQALRAEVCAVAWTDFGGVGVPVPEVDALQRAVARLPPGLEEGSVEIGLQAGIEHVGGAAGRLRGGIGCALVT